MNKLDEYFTKDLGEAAALLAKGVKLLGLDKGSGFFWFVFESTNSLKISNSYWSGELLVSAKDFYDKTRSLKDRLFSQKQEGESKSVQHF